MRLLCVSLAVLGGLARVASREWRGVAAAARVAVARRGAWRGHRACGHRAGGWRARGQEPTVGGSRACRGAEWATAGVPLVFLQREGLGVGEVVQARYLLPLILVLVLTLSLRVPFRQATDGGLPLPGVLAWVIAVGIAAAASVSPDAQRRVRIHLPLARRWKDLYVSWNLAFTSTYGDSPYFAAALLALGHPRPLAPPAARHRRAPGGVGQRRQPGGDLCLQRWRRSSAFGDRGLGRGMPRLLHHLQVKSGPALLQLKGPGDRTDHVEPTVDQHTGEVEATLGNVRQRAAFRVVEKAVMGEVMRLAAGHAPGRLRRAERPAPGQRGTGRFIARPRFPGRQPYPTVAVVQPVAVTRKRVVAPILGQGLQPAAVGVGVEPAQSVEEPLPVCTPTEEQPAQHQPAHAVRVLARVGQCQRGAPGPADGQLVIPSTSAIFVEF